MIIPILSVAIIIVGLIIGLPLWVTYIGMGVIFTTMLYHVYPRYSWASYRLKGVRKLAAFIAASVFLVLAFPVIPLAIITRR